MTWLFVDLLKVSSEISSRAKRKSCWEALRRAPQSFFSTIDFATLHWRWGFDYCAACLICANNTLYPWHCIDYLYSYARYYSRSVNRYTKKRRYCMHRSKSRSVIVVSCLRRICSWATIHKSCMNGAHETVVSITQQPQAWPQFAANPYKQTKSRFSR
jgi:hypothetical protein